MLNQEQPIMNGTNHYQPPQELGQGNMFSQEQPLMNGGGYNYQQESGHRVTMFNQEQPLMNDTNYHQPTQENIFINKHRTPDEIPPEYVLEPSAPPYDIPPVPPPMWNELQSAEYSTLMTQIHTMNTFQDVPQSYSYMGWDAETWMEGISAAKTAVPADRDPQDDPDVRGLRLLVGRTTHTAGTEGIAFQKITEPDKVARVCISIEQMDITTRPIWDTQAIPQSIKDYTKLYIHNTDGLNVVRKLCYDSTEQTEKQKKKKKKKKKIAYLIAGSMEQTGGGWERGYFGVEEDLFYRTNMSSIEHHNNGAMVMYTSNVTLFRNTESRGYFFLEKSGQVVFDVISLSTPDLSKRTDKSLHNEDIVCMRRNLAMSFSEAIRNKANTLVLTPFGCDHRLWPPEAVSAVIKAVTEQYAGFIPEIHVVISAELFPAKVYETFMQVLMNSSGRRINIPATFKSQPADSTRIQCCPSFDTCKESAEENPQHFESFYHSPVCPIGEGCEETYAYHKILFTHPHTIQSDTHSARNKSSEAKTTQLPFCKDPFTCPFVRKPSSCFTAEDRAHILKFRHFCQLGVQCSLINNPAHTRCFAHLHARDICLKGASCSKINDLSHRLEFMHEGVMNFPVKCFEGKKCHLASDKVHKSNFYHKGEPKDIKECYSLQWLSKHKIGFS